ncbi:MAG: methyltransferase domain-containing protein [Fibrobacter sp.]|nr:methyltransferase domain-containing protein [Fibrobacter sp.]
MAGANSVTSNQETLHKDLEEVVRKYARTTFLRPIAGHTREAFAQAEEFVKKFYADCATRNATESLTAAGNGDPEILRLRSGQAQCGVTSGMCEADPGPSTSSGTFTKAVILDSGCGTGESTIHIARRFPNIPVIGIDKSFARLNKAGNPVQTAGEDVPRNAFWIRAELLDFWRLALDRVKTGEWVIPYHAIYYPNPWPKQSEATRRFHMHPIFPTLLALGGVTELRTNWEIYAREFAEAARIVLSDRSEAGMAIKCESFAPAAPETAFERKYKDAGQKLWRVTVKR